MLDTIEQYFNAKPRYESINTEAGGRTIINKLEYGSEEFTAKADRVSLGAITDEGGGLYQIADISFTGLSLRSSMPELAFDMTFKAPTMRAENWFVWRLKADATAMEKFRATNISAKTMSADDLVMTMSGFDFHADRYEATWSGDPRTGSGTSSGKIVNLAAPPELLSRASPDSPVKRLGYEEIVFDIGIIADTKMGADTFDIGLALTVDGHDIGTLSVSAAASAIPFVALVELDRADDADEEPDFSGMMEALNKAAFVGARLRFEDKSITRKLLPMAAADQGLEEEQLIAMAGPMVQMSLASLNAPELTRQAGAAINAFLKDPKSITFAIKPATPVTWGELLAINPDKPDELFNRFGATLSAND